VKSAKGAIKTFQLEEKTANLDHRDRLWYCHKFKLIKGMRYFKHLCSNFNMVIASEVLSFDFLLNVVAHHRSQFVFVVWCNCLILSKPDQCQLSSVSRNFPYSWNLCFQIFDFCSQDNYLPDYMYFTSCISIETVSVFSIAKKQNALNNLRKCYRTSE